MACNCRNKQEMTDMTNAAITDKVIVEDSRAEAVSINLKQCYECAKKHVSRAKEEFKEYHTGYPEHIKNLMMSMRVAEADIRGAFLKWCEVQAQLDMGAGELLGRDINGDTMKASHVQVAKAIRKERLQLNIDPLYVPDFDALLVSIQTLEYQSLA